MLENWRPGVGKDTIYLVSGGEIPSHHLWLTFSLFINLINWERKVEKV